uniref:tRNA (adenosine(37)-N6)-dimethylallyltransferase MiaA n=2 Tax=Roseivirga sp. TaxID=1964215 RepID=UPI004047BBDF
MKTNKLLIAIVGPTAVGKTEISIKIANHFGAEIISADSRQFYRELELGTAKPDATELSQAKHYLINCLSIEEEYDVRDFENEALEIISTSLNDHDTMIMVGGSGLFVNALAYGLDELPEVEDGVRDKLKEELTTLGLIKLQNELKESDPEYHALVDLNNPQRVIRALEVVRSTGKPFSTFRTGQRVERPFRILWVGLEMERAQLYKRIDARMDQMIAKGLFQEAQQFYPKRDLNALQTVGYKEIFGYLDGDYDKEEAIRLLKRNSRRYAKRQMTWFKKNQEITWFNPNDLDEILEHIKKEMQA